MPREFGVVRERLLNAIGVAAAQRPRRMPRQQGLDLVSLFLIHGQSRSIPFALRSEEGTWIARQCPRMARLPLMHQSSTTWRGRAATPFPAVAPVNPEMFGSDLTCSRNTPCQHPALKLRRDCDLLRSGRELLRRCALFATGGEPNEVSPTSGAM